MDLARLERYKEIVGDWGAFADAARAPLPITLWVNTLRHRVGQVRRVLEEQGIELEPLPWTETGFEAAYGTRPGKTLAYITGAFHMQEEVSMLPVPLLDPRPGERVLDLCAAPGNKTLQAAVHMEGTGTLVANDIHRDRVGMVVRNVERMGLAHVIVTHWNGANLPADAGLFDRVLADVPCSCEGTTRKNPEILLRERPESDRWVGAQEALLRKAVQRCRPGGRIVYSTCTYAPEENEQVVHTVLGEYPDEVRIADAELDGFRFAPGLTEWQGTTYHPDLARTLRAYPHMNDTGGFYVAVLEKLGTPDAAQMEATGSEATGSEATGSGDSGDRS